MREAAALFVVNTLTSRNDEDPHEFLCRNGLDPSMLEGCKVTLQAEPGIARSSRQDRFNGITFALLSVEVPAGREVPSLLQQGQSIGPLLCQCPSSGQQFGQRFVQFWDKPLDFSTPLPRR